MNPKVHEIVYSTDSREELAERIVKLEEENAKLRQERDHWHVEQVHAYGNWEDAHKRASELESENAKLRKIVEDMRKAFFTLDIDHCQACPRDTINGPCTKYLVGGSDECNFEEELRELGIGVE